MAKFHKSSETFFVEEVPLIEPCGNGEHSFFKVKKENLSTNWIANNLKNVLKIKEQDIGYAGNKDKLSTAIQTFSLPKRLEDKAILFFSKFNCEVLELKRHNEKLRMGQIKGNRFKVKIELDSKDEEKDIEKKLREIEIKGFPNFFGPQRVKKEESFEMGRSIFLKNLKRGKREDRFNISVFQSRIFNFYLEKRIDRGFYPYAIDGDALFIPEDERYITFSSNIEIEGAFPTGPIVGSKMRLPERDSLLFEREILKEFGLDLDVLLFNRVPGSRRILTIIPSEISLKRSSKDQMELGFFLYKGSFASTLLDFLGIETILQESKRDY
jgi:tRNA pseudouridine13 synthase